MKIQIVSDLHWWHNKDQWEKHIQNLDGADVLVVAGDLNCGSFNGRSIPEDKHQLAKLTEYGLEYLASRWQKVVICWGNHDLYWGKFPEYCGHVEKIGDVTFICTPLFTDVSKTFWGAVKAFVDFSRILDDQGNRIKLVHYGMYHKRCKAFLEDAVIAAEGKVVVVTHHLPSWRLIDDEYKGDDWSPLFATEMDLFIRKYSHKISLWVHGHSHEPDDRIIEGVRVIRNPLGYLGLGEGRRFNPSLIVEL